MKGPVQGHTQWHRRSIIHARSLHQHSVTISHHAGPSPPRRIRDTPARTSWSKPDNYSHTVQHSSRQRAKQRQVQFLLGGCRRFTNRGIQADSPIDSPLPPSQSLPAQAQSQTARQTAAAAAPAPAASLEPLSYHVHRTPSQQLPIYQKRKRGGTLLQTRVQKVTGRVEDLKHALQKELQIPEGKIIVNPTNRHIIVKVRGANGAVKCRQHERSTGGKQSNAEHCCIPVRTVLNLSSVILIHEHEHEANWTFRCRAGSRKT